MDRFVRARWVIAAGLGIALVMFLVIVMYGGQGRLPKGVSVSGWEPGPLSYVMFRQELSFRVKVAGERLVAVGVSKEAEGDGRTDEGQQDGGQQYERQQHEGQQHEGQHTMNSSNSKEAVQTLRHEDAESARYEEVTLSAADWGVRWNEDELAARVKPLFVGSLWERAKARWRFDKQLALRAGVDDAAMRRAADAAWPELAKQQPVDAKRRITADDRVEYTPHKSAYRVDTVALARALTARVGGPLWAGLAPQPGLRLGLRLRQLDPELTLAELRAQGVQRKIAEFSTPIKSTSAGREFNMSAAAKEIYDSMLAPGEVFDYSKIIKQAETNSGFRPAPVILNGRMVPGVGGGICQISSTLYVAVLRAGLEIVERRNHSLPVSYAPLGQDATYAGGYINFKFKNTTGKHMVIRTYLQNGRVVAKLFGTLPANVKYELSSKTVRTIPSPVKYVRNPYIPLGTEQLVQRGKEGYVVETYRYKKVNGRTAATERISRDTYKPQATIIAANTGKAPLPKSVQPRLEPDVIEDGVALLEP
ncbi:VanW family protein [Paenibacillus gansuensis]|uniref:VanW family protein n=1 Tax=Paenibacillus gansuensis TaxID=306542 RepID=A0ABW5PMG6_9BACL